MASLASGTSFDVYTYKPDGWHSLEVIEVRAKYLAEKYASLVGGVYRGNLDIRKRPSDNSICIVPCDIVSPEEDVVSLINQNGQIYGAIVETIKSTKSICHLPRFNSYPSQYTMNFHEALNGLGVSLRGCVVFSIDHLIQAIRLFREDNISIRLKLPLGSGVENQMKLVSTIRDTDIRQWISDRVTNSDIDRIGIVVEEEVKPANDVFPFAISSGQIEILNSVYTYVGWQRKAKNGEYGGTVLYVNKGEVFPRIEELPADLGPLSEKIVQACKNTLVQKAGRINLNFLYGYTSVAKSPRLYFTEPTFRPGGASPAELCAIEALSNINSLHGMWGATSIVYGEDDMVLSGDVNNEVVWTGKDSEYGARSIQAHVFSSKPLGV